MIKAIVSISFLILFLGCVSVPKQPVKTGLELQAIQSRTFKAEKDVVFASVLSVFQDLGYIISAADIKTGIITAKSPTNKKTDFWWGSVMVSTKVSAFIEQFSNGDTKVRINLVHSDERQAYGNRSDKEVVITDNKIYENAFTKIQEAIFIRQNAK